MQHKLRLAYYPEQLVDPVPGQLRNAAHTDFAGFTILLQDSAPGGLQVLMPDGSWIGVPSVPGTLVINTGDLLQRWTNRSLGIECPSGRESAPGAARIESPALDRLLYGASRRR